MILTEAVCALVYDGRAGGNIDCAGGIVVGVLKRANRRRWSWDTSLNIPKRKRIERIDCVEVWSGYIGRWAASVAHGCSKGTRSAAVWFGSVREGR